MNRRAGCIIRLHQARYGARVFRSCAMLQHRLPYPTHMARSHARLLFIILPLVVLQLVRALARHELRHILARMRRLARTIVAQLAVGIHGMFRLARRELWVGHLGVDRPTQHRDELVEGFKVGVVRGELAMSLRLDMLPSALPLMTNQV